MLASVGNFIGNFGQLQRHFNRPKTYYEMKY